MNELLSFYINMERQYVALHHRHHHHIRRKISTAPRPPTKFAKQTGPAPFASIATLTKSSVILVGGLPILCLPVWCTDAMVTTFLLEFIRWLHWLRCCLLLSTSPLLHSRVCWSLTARRVVCVRRTLHTRCIILYTRWTVKHNSLFVWLWGGYISTKNMCTYSFIIRYIHIVY